MTPAEAAKLLDLPDHATPPQIEARFLELRAALEDKIAKALTPGLQERYRASLAELTTAFETLVLAAEKLPAPNQSQIQLTSLGSAAPRLPSLPPLPASSAARAPSLPPMPAMMAPPPAPVAPPPPPAPPARSSGKGLFIGVAVAVLVLAAGGGAWWWQKDAEAKAAIARAETEARLAAEKIRAEAEAAEKARLAAIEREQQAKWAAEQRARLATIHTAFDSTMRGRLAAETEFRDMTTRLDALTADGKADTPAGRLLAARRTAQSSFVAWLNANIPNHPAKAARAKAEAALASRSPETPALADAYAQSVEQLKADIATAKSSQSISAPLALASNLEGTSWSLVDAFGVERSGTAPAALADVALGKAVVVFHREGWPDEKAEIDLLPAGGSLKADFPIGSLRLETEPAGAEIYRGDQLLGKSPLEVPQVATGPVAFRFVLKGYRPLELKGTVESGKTFATRAVLARQRATDLDFILEAAMENLALVESPETRTNILYGLLASIGRRSDMPAAKTQSLLAAHLDACRAIPDPQLRMQRTASFLFFGTLTGLDPGLGRAWAEESLRAAASLTDNEQRKQATTWASYTALHPDLLAAFANTADNWFPANDDWIFRATVAQLHARAGDSAGAQRMAARSRDPSPSGTFQNDMVRDYVTTGTGSYQSLALRLALAKGDLNTARQEAAKQTAKIELSDFISIAMQFMQLGDFETPLKLSRLTENEYYLAADALGSLISFACGALNFPIAEKWAASLTDTAEKPRRSAAYRDLAQHYLMQGMPREAAAAAAKVTTFDSGDYATDRFQLAQICAELGQADRARQLIASGRLDWKNPQQSYRLQTAAPAFLVLGDKDSFERAFQTLTGDSRDYMMYTTALILSRMGRYEEAVTILPRIQSPELQYNTRSVVNGARIRRANDAQIDELYEKSQPGAERLGVLSGVLQLQQQRASLARYSAPGAAK